ncbi:hypothetical protein GQ457_10G019450 [Hibiscus cannabinus]
MTSSYTQAAGKQFSCLTGGGSSSNVPVDLSSQSFQPLVSLPSAPMSFATSPITSAMNGGAWCPDSGASHHVTYNQSNLQSGVPYAGNNSLLIGGGAGVLIRHVGQGSIYTSAKPLFLQNLLHVATIKKNLLSVSQLTRDNNVFFEFHADGCYVKDSQTRNVLLEGRLTHEGLYQLLPTVANKTLSQPSPSAEVYTTSKSQNVFDLWHKRLGHPSNHALRTVFQSCGIASNSNKVSHVCVPCLQGKACKLPFSHSLNEYKEPFELVVSDLWGPTPISSDGFFYYVTFIDVFTRYTWLYLVRKKSEVSQCFINFHKLVEVQFGKRIKALQTDGGTEYQSLKNWVSCPHTSEQNGKAERKHRHVVETGLSLLAQAALPLKYWNHAFTTVVFLINRTPTDVLKGLTPYEKLHGKVPDYSLMKVFGCACYPNMRLFNRHKFDFRTKRCIFMGYNSSYKGYKCMNESGRVFVSRHVVFDEDSFPCLGSHDSVTGTTLHQQSFPLLVSQSVPCSTSSVPPVNLQESTTSLTCESSSGGLPLSPRVVDSQQNVVHSVLERPLEPELVPCPGAEVLSNARAESCPASLGGSLEPEPEPNHVDGVSDHEQSEASQQSARVQDDSFQLEPVAEQFKAVEVFLFRLVWILELAKSARLEKQGEC